MRTTWRNASTDSLFAAKVSPTSVPGDDDADGRNPEEPRDPGDGVVDCGRDAGFVLIGVGKDGRRQRGNGEGEPE